VEAVHALREHPHGLAVVEVGQAHGARRLLPPGYGCADTDTAIC
jgi:hypothetical protein